jgi:hypothetical protein
MTTRDWVGLIFSVVLLGFLLFQYRRWETKRMKQRTYEAMSPGLRGEIDDERQRNLQKKQKFMDAMDKAGGGKNV